MSQRPHVVIVGGGFGGLEAARALRGQDVDVTLIDRRNHHLFQPLLYQVATAGLAPSDIAEPLRAILRHQDNVVVRMAHVAEIDLEGKRLRLTPVPDPEQTVQALVPSEWMSWDRLILAVGVSHSYFGHDEWAVHAPGLKTIGDALEIRRRILTAFERAEWTNDPDERRALLTFVVVGAGPTGVELAGAIREIAVKTMRRDFRRIHSEDARVVVVEGLGGVLPVYPERLQEQARVQLESLGVEVRLNTMVKGVDHDGVLLGEEQERLRAGTVLWAAGVQAPPLTKTLGVELHRSGRVPVGPDLSIPDHPEAFVIGDLAVVEEDGRQVPGLAPAAMQMGRFVAKVVRADLAGRERPHFHYRDRGSMATIGRRRAVLQSGRLQLSGWFAWILWVFVHLMTLVTFRNRVVVFVKWAWAWFSFEKASRLIWQGERPPDEALPLPTGKG